MRATTVDLQYHVADVDGTGFKCGAADVELSARVRKARTGRLHDRMLIVPTARGVQRRTHHLAHVGAGRRCRDGIEVRREEWFDSLWDQYE